MTPQTCPYTYPREAASLKSHYLSTSSLQCSAQKCMLKIIKLSYRLHAFMWLCPHLYSLSLRQQCRKTCFVSYSRKYQPSPRQIYMTLNRGLIGYFWDLNSACLISTFRAPLSAATLCIRDIVYGIYISFMSLHYCLVLLFPMQERQWGKRAVYIRCWTSLSYVLQTTGTSRC